MSDRDVAASSPRPLFDLASSEGVNDSERTLTKLCQRSFLRLWSQTNVFTDEGFKDGKGGTKELCDALVIFGDDVIIFSDKHVKFQIDRELQVAWPRWYRPYATAADARFFGQLAARQDRSATVMVEGEVIERFDEPDEPRLGSGAASA